MADSLAGIGRFNKIDPQFTAVKPSAETLRIAALNAAPGQTAEQYLASRGGVNAAGYYGDSWSAATNLTDKEYFAAIDAAKRAGATGTFIGAAINEATQAKSASYYLANPNEMPNQLLLQEYQSGRLSKEQFETMVRAGYWGADRNETVLALRGGKIQKPPVGVLPNGTLFYGYDASGKPITDPNAASVTISKPTGSTGDGTNTNPLLVNGIPFTGVSGNTNYVNGVAQVSYTDADTKARRTAQQDFRAALGEMGLTDLADEVDRMIKDDFTVAQIKIELPKTTAYKTRFPGMEALRASGRAISEAVYISNEKGYLQTLRAYGLDTNILGSRSELGKYIANEVSPREFEERVNIAATRVKDNPDVMAAFKTYYPEADESGMITYLLNPKAGMDVIKKQIRVSEIGAAATRAGFAQDLVTSGVAESLIGAVGETNYAQISNEFQRARLLANNQRRLAQIEGQQYTDLEAIGAVVGDDVTKALASERRAARETARFSGGAGLSGASLRSAPQI